MTLLWTRGVFLTADRNQHGNTRANATLALPTAYLSDWRRLCKSRIQLLRASLNRYMQRFSRSAAMHNEILCRFSRGTWKIPIPFCSSGSETPSVARNGSRHLTFSHEGISLKKWCASDVSSVLAFNSLPTSLHRTLHLFSSLLLTDIDPTHKGWFLIPFGKWCVSGHVVVQFDRFKPPAFFASSSTHQFWLFLRCPRSAAPFLSMCVYRLKWEDVFCWYQPCEFVFRLADSSIFEQIYF